MVPQKQTSSPGEAPPSRVSMGSARHYGSLMGMNRKQLAMLRYGTDLSGLTTRCPSCLWSQQGHPSAAWVDLTRHYREEHPGDKPPPRPDEYAIRKWRYDRAVDDTLRAEATTRWSLTVGPYLRASESLIEYVKANGLERTQRDPLTVIAEEWTPEFGVDLSVEGETEPRLSL